MDLADLAIAPAMTDVIGAAIHQDLEAPDGGSRKIATASLTNPSETSVSCDPGRAVPLPAYEPWVTSRGRAKGSQDSQIVRRRRRR